jgi:acyl dehydratase
MTDELLGTRLPDAVLVLERSPVTAFAEAVGSTQRAYASETAAREAGLPGIPLPPTASFAMGHWAAPADLQPANGPDRATLRQLIDRLREGRPGLVLHGEQSFDYYAPVSVGDVLHATGSVTGAHQKPSSDGRHLSTYLVVRTEYHRPDGELVLAQTATILHRAPSQTAG